MTGFLQEETERFRKALQDIDGDMIKVCAAGELVQLAHPTETSLRDHKHCRLEGAWNQLDGDSCVAWSPAALLPQNAAAAACLLCWPQPVSRTLGLPQGFCSACLSIPA